MTRTFQEVYRLLDPEDPILVGDSFTMQSLFDSIDHGPWGPCDRFVGKRVREVEDRGRLLFRRLIAHEIHP